MSKQKVCPNCGYVSENDEDFCPNCDKVFGKETLHTEPSHEINAEEQTRSHDERIGKETNEEKESSDDSSESSVAEVEESVRQDMTSVERKTSQMDKQATEESRQTTTVEAKEKNQSTSTPPKKKKGKMIVGILAVLVVIIGFIAFNRYQDQKEQERIQAIEKKSNKLQKQLNGLYLNKEHLYLNENFDEGTLDSLTNAVGKIEEDTYKKPLKETVADIKRKSEQQSKVNELFTEDIVKGQNLTNATIKEPEMTIPDDIHAPRDDFEKLMNEGYKEARTQVTTNKEAKEQVSKMIENNEVKKDATRDAYTRAVEKVDAVKHPLLKKELTEELKKVDDYLTKQEIEKKKKDEEEARQKEEAQKKEAQKKVSSEKPRASLPNNDGNGEGAYAWAPGIKEKVIGECLNRGYMSPDGYTLVKKEVKNGEGFYELYATNTNSKLLKGSKDTNVPVYLVTINCKTGWFKGNGPAGS